MSKPFIALSPTDRLKHLWCLGKSGMGKSTFLHNLFVQDVLAGRGCALIDPHGDLSEDLLTYIPPARRRDVIYFNPLDLEFPIGLNVLERVKPELRPRIADGILSTFQDIWRDNWGPALHELLEHALLAMLDIPGGNLVAMKFLITDDTYREQVLKYIKDPIIRGYWEQDWSALPERLRRERSLSTLNKLRAFITDPTLRNILGQSRSSIDFKRVLDHKKILIANLNKGRLGRGKSQLLGALLVAQFYLAAMTRPKHADLPPFFLYIDEFQSFSTSTFEQILSEARGYGLGLTIAHQYLDQLDQKLLAALKGNVSTIVSFRLGDEDADQISRNLGLEEPQTLMDLEAFTARIRAAQRHGSKDTLALMQPKLGKPYARAKTAIINHTREKFCHPRSKIEKSMRFIFV